MVRVDVDFVAVEPGPRHSVRRRDGNRNCGDGAVLPDGSLAVPGDYTNPNCWPGAIYCARGYPIDTTVIEKP